MDNCGIFYLYLGTTTGMLLWIMSLAGEGMHHSSAWNYSHLCIYLTSPPEQDPLQLKTCKELTKQATKCEPSKQDISSHLLLCLYFPLHFPSSFGAYFLLSQFPPFIYSFLSHSFSLSFLISLFHSSLNSSCSSLTPPSLPITHSPSLPLTQCCTSCWR